METERRVAVKKIKPVTSHSSGTDRGDDEYDETPLSPPSSGALQSLCSSHNLQFPDSSLEYERMEWSCLHPHKHMRSLNLARLKYTHFVMCNLQQISFHKLLSKADNVGILFTCSSFVTLQPDATTVYTFFPSVQ